jgi:hypothetical protein
MKYTVILFKNKERKKILKNFKTLERANTFFDSLIKKSNSIVFNKEIENGFLCDFEIGIIDNDPNEFENYFVRDYLGRQKIIKTEDSNSRIIKISPYKIEETIYDLTLGKKITIDSFYKKYIVSDTIKVISKINNKFFIQEDDAVSLFSLKSESDCLRFFLILENYLQSKKKNNCLLVSDSSIQQKKYLYSLLENKGISKKVLYKQSTTFFKS